MKIEQIEEALELKKKLDAYLGLRKDWSQVDLTDVKIVDALYSAHHGCSTMPSVTVDAEMQSCIVQAIVGEYDSRIRDIQDQLDEFEIESKTYVSQKSMPTGFREPVRPGD